MIEEGADPRVRDPLDVGLHDAHGALIAVEHVFCERIDFVPHPSAPIAWKTPSVQQRLGRTYSGGMASANQVVSLPRKNEMPQLHA